MSKQLYEEALADAKKLKEIAEDNAKRALVEAVTPRIRDLIEKELLRESYDDDLDEDVPGAPGSPMMRGDLMTDYDALPAVVPTDEEGDAVIDLDRLFDEPTVPYSQSTATDTYPAGFQGFGAEPQGVAVEPPMFGDTYVDDDEEQQFELNQESIDALAPLIGEISDKNFSSNLRQFERKLVAMLKLPRRMSETKEYSDNISQMIAEVENMYAYVQESMVDPGKKNAYENKLENYFSQLTRLQEQKMSSRLNRLLSEKKLEFSIDNIEFDNVDDIVVDIVSDEEGEESDEEETEGGEEGEEGEGEELDLSGLGGEDEGEDEETKAESRRHGDDVVVEINEGMLRRELARMQRLREADETKPYKGPGPGVGFDDFGGGDDEGEPLDVSLSEGLHEDDDDLDEMYEATDDEQDSKDEAYDVAEYGGNERPDTNKQARQPGRTLESKLIEARHKKNENKMKAQKAQKKVQETQKKMQAKKVQAKMTKSKKAQKEAVELSHQVARLSEAYSYFVEQYNRCARQEKKIMGALNESIRNESARNAGSRRSAAETENLRAKLTETNLFNAKLVYTNKLLQNESLSKRQKAEIIERLDEAQNLREVKLVYESLSKTLAGTSRPLTENTERSVIGSSSRATRPASTNLTEGYETDRWARLAGINK